MCRIEYQGESLATFLVNEGVIDATHADLGLIASSVPVRSVSVNSLSVKLFRRSRYTEPVISNILLVISKYRSISN